MDKILNLKVLQHFDDTYDEKNVIFITKFHISDEDLEKSAKEISRLIEISYGCFKCCCLGEDEMFTVLIDCENSDECEDFGIYHSRDFYNGGDDFIYANANCDFLEETVENDIMEYFNIPKKKGVLNSTCVEEFFKNNPKLDYKLIKVSLEMFSRRMFEYEIINNILKTFLQVECQDVLLKDNLCRENKQEENDDLTDSKLSIGERQMFDSFATYKSGKLNEVIEKVIFDYSHLVAQSSIDVDKTAVFNSLHSSNYTYLINNIKELLRYYISVRLSEKLNAHSFGMRHIDEILDKIDVGNLSQTLEEIIEMINKYIEKRTVYENGFSCK